MTVLIHGYRLVKTCNACPEQYDVYAGNKMVAYMRLRHGSFTVEVPDCGGKLLFTAFPKGDGMFDDDERLYFLTKAIVNIQHHYLNDDDY